MDQGLCSDCEAYGLKKHGLTRSDCIYTGVDGEGQARVPTSSLSFVFGKNCEEP